MNFEKLASLHSALKEISGPASKLLRNVNRWIETVDAAEVLESEEDDPALYALFAMDRHEAGLRALNTISMMSERGLIDALIDILEDVDSEAAE